MTTVLATGSTNADSAATFSVTLDNLAPCPPVVRHGGHARVRSNRRADDHRGGLCVSLDLYIRVRTA